MDFDTSGGTHRTFCPPCWNAWFESKVVSSNSLPAVCVECGARARLEGTGKFQGLGYCVKCYATFAREDMVKEMGVMHAPFCYDCGGRSGDAHGSHEVIGLCAECERNPGESNGRRDFGELSYCGGCWKRWLNPHVQICLDCRAQLGEAESSYCGRCQKRRVGRSCLECNAQLEKAENSYCDCCQQRWDNAKTKEWHKALCSECKLQPGEFNGTEGFLGLVYCGRCWRMWKNLSETERRYCEQRTRSRYDEMEEAGDGTIVLCIGCKVTPGAFFGREHFGGLAYCQRCWASWMNSVTLDEDTVECKAPSKGKQHYDFIEVGTSTWGTLTQYCAGDEWKASGLGPDMYTRADDPYYARGLAVEVVRSHLDMLPTLPNVTKICAAMDENSGADTLYYVSSENIERHMGQYHSALSDDGPFGTEVDVMWYAISLSSIGQPQPELQYMLRNVGRPDLLEQQHVSVLSWEDICTQHSVATVDVVQVDCEGKDCAILRGLLAYCEGEPSAFPRIIQFECNQLTGNDEIEATLNSLMQRGGYELRSRTSQNIIVERPYRAHDSHQ